MYFTLTRARHSCSQCLRSFWSARFKMNEDSENENGERMRAYLNLIFLHPVLVILRTNLDF
jgi:hypothetical protein